MPASSESCWRAPKLVLLPCFTLLCSLQGLLWIVLASQKRYISAQRDWSVLKPHITQIAAGKTLASFCGYYTGFVNCASLLSCRTDMREWKSGLQLSKKVLVSILKKPQCFLVAFRYSLGLFIPEVVFCCSSAFLLSSREGRKLITISIGESQSYRALCTVTIGGGNNSKASWNQIAQMLRPCKAKWAWFLHKSNEVSLVQSENCSK